MQRNDIFGDFRRKLSRTTVIKLRKQYEAAEANTDNPEALAELLQSEPKYKDRVVNRFVVLVGSWARPIEDGLIALLQAEFSLPALEFVFDEHWNVKP